MTATHPGIIKALNHAITEYGCSRQEAIALVMKTMVETGISPRKALDAMFGEGTHLQLVDQVWTELQPAA
jgi:hypothetical protein